MESEVCGEGNGIVVCDDDPVNFVVEAPSEPSIDIEKYVQKESADVPEGPVIEAGTSALFDYRIENTGLVTLTNVTVIDDTLGVIVSGITLQPGEVRWYQRRKIVTELGVHFMESEVCGEYNGIVVCDDDPVNFVVIGDSSQG